MDLMDICYGPNISIYDVLGLNQDASIKEIQSAFIARRLELYKLSETIEDDKERVIKDKYGDHIVITEKDFLIKKMDALSAAFKLLRDPEQRKEYDSNLNLNEAAASAASSSGTNTTKHRHRRTSPASIMDSQGIKQSSTDTINHLTRTSSKKKISKSNKSKKGKDNKEPIKSDRSLEKRDDDEYVQHYYRDVVRHRETGLGSWLRKNRYRSQADTVDTVATEIKGSVADIALSFSQIMAAFSVDEEAIDAMAKNIGDTSHQLSGRSR